MSRKRGTRVYIVQDDKEHLPEGASYGTGIYNANTGELVTRYYGTSEEQSDEKAHDFAKRMDYKVVELDGVPGDAVGRLWTTLEVPDVWRVWATRHHPEFGVKNVVNAWFNLPDGEELARACFVKVVNMLTGWPMTDIHSEDRHLSIREILEDGPTGVEFRVSIGSYEGKPDYKELASRQASE
jgi:hypothetical protein